MLVKIIAMGLTPAVWKNVFHHLRLDLPQHPFAAGIFTSAEDLTFLSQDFFPRQWALEHPDLLLCEPPLGEAGPTQLEFLRAVSSHPLNPPVALGLALDTLEEGLRRLLQSPVPVELYLDAKARFSISDPALLIPVFPDHFPRFRINEHLTAILLRRKGRHAAAVKPEAMHPGTIYGFAEIEAIQAGGETFSPRKWLVKTLKAAGVKMDEKLCPGLIREADGVYLFPGIPVERVSAVRMGEVTFTHLIGLGHLHLESASYERLLKTIQKASNRLNASFSLHSGRLRLAETKTDIPILVGGGMPLVRDTLTQFLTQQGFRRCVSLEQPLEGEIREPSLLIQTGDWPVEDTASQLEPPTLWRIESALSPRLAPLTQVPGWERLECLPPQAGNPVLDVQGLTQALEEAAQRDRKAAEGLDFAQKRALLLNQEVLILEKAEQQLAQLTGNTAPILAWGDPLPESAHQALVLSFDPEEAGAALHAMPEIDRKRWFDLSPCNTPESLAGLSLAPLEDYRQGGVVVITTAARERIRALAVTLRERLAAAQAILSENSSAREFYEQERVQSQVERENLVRLWVQGVVADWLEEHQAELLDYLAVLRERSERRWFSRGLISRVVVIPSSQDTGEVLLSACRQVLPALSRDQSRIMPYEYRPEPKLPSDQREALLLKARETRQPAPVLRNTLDQSLRMINRERLLEYLDNLTGELRVTRTDLLVIEQPLELAGATLEHLRQALPHLSQIPAIVILPEAWSPEPNEGLPWPRTRVMLLRRLGSFSIEDASSRLLTLFTP